MTATIPGGRYRRAAVHTGVITRRNLLVNVRQPDVLARLAGGH
jgi:hypothetical protein